MKITEYYSHLNGLEFIQFHRPQLWTEIKEIIASVDAGEFRSRASNRKTILGEFHYAPIALNQAVKSIFTKHKWQPRTAAFWVTNDVMLIRRTLNLPAAEQRKEILAAGHEATRSFNASDLVKDRIAVEVQFEGNLSVSYDLFVKHLAFYEGDVIDVGIEIVPMRSFAASTIKASGKRSRNMSTGVPWYEKELYNLIREGRGVPGVPLVIVGVEP